jgi:hypothetical protein
MKKYGLFLLLLTALSVVKAELPALRESGDFHGGEELNRGDFDHRDLNRNDLDRRNVNKDVNRTNLNQAVNRNEATEDIELRRENNAAEANALEEDAENPIVIEGPPTNTDEDADELYENYLNPK